MPFQHSFWIIGETTLAIRCAEVLRDRAHDVRGLITAHPVAAAWARERSIDVIPFRDALSALSRTPYDFLLSIVNSRILGADILSTPTVGAINYHDGPLPRYAGMHSTSWAILNEETEHGITWHGVAELVDAGPIFKQRPVPIDPDETALSLNAKSYEAALDAFVELVDDIGNGRLAGREQDLSLRTYFPRLARPPAAGLVDWDRPANAASALVRALDFGAAYPNPLGRAKVRCGSGIYLCNRLRVTTQAVSAAPGTVMALGAAGITVAAADREVVIESVATLDGRDVELGGVIARERLAVGRLLAPMEPAALANLSERNSELAAHEGHWLRALRRIQAPEVPYRTAGSVPTGRYHRASVPRPANDAAADAAADAADARTAELVAAFAALVSRLTAEGSVHLALEHPALRPRADELPSPFASSVPVEIAAHHSVSFDQHVTAVRDALANAASHGTYALDLPARYPDLGRRPALPIQVRIAPVGEPGEQSTAELILDVADGKAEIRGDSGVMSATDVARVSEQLATLLAAIAAHPGIPLGAAPIVPERERQRLVSEWNATASPYPKQMTIHGLFAERARSIPDAPAVISDGTALTFGELDARAECWARVLQTHGIGRDAIVGLRTGRTPELVVGMLAILKAGGAYLPLDLSLPSARTQFMLDDARVKVVLTTRALHDDLEAGPRTLLCIDGTPDVGRPATTSSADPDSLAYVIYTSGSTGTPKGVLVHHQGAVNYLWWAIRHYRATEGSGSPVHSPVAFDLTVTSLIAPLLAGRPVHLLDEGLGVGALADALRTGRDFTLVKLTPSHLDLLRHQLAPDEAAGRARAFVIGGENLQGAGLAFWQEHAPDTRLINEYGPTETVVGCCIYDVPADQVIRGSVPIGRPIANTRLYVLDPAMQLLPIGIAGELYIGGDGVARGYLNRPELTAERFIPDPFDPSGGRLYRTGDRVRYLPDGNLEFLGRLDGQVKVRGYRIELGEIESAIASHPAVSEAAATVWQDPVAGPRLVGYVTLPGTAAPSTDELREWCARFLPDYMIPASFERLDRLPLTGNGKVDRGALPMPAARRTALVEPRTELERRLTTIWSEVLGVPVGITDNFFELGGHSLLAVQMIARVREATGQAPPLSVLLTRPTVEHVAAALAGDEPSEPDPMMVCIAGGASTPFFFLHGDFASGGFYVQTIARHLDPDQPMYSIRPPHPGGPSTIEGMAALTLDLIRSVQPTGPYLLGGNCNGGAVAFEIARLLRARGDEVRLLALVNTAHRNAHFEPVRRIARLAAIAGRMDARRTRAFYLRLRESVLRTMEHRPYGPLDRSEMRRTLWWAGTLGATMARALRGLAATAIRRLQGRPPVMEAGQFRPIRDDLGLPVADSDGERLARYRYIDEAMREYLARPLDVPVTLIWWEQSGALDADPELHGDDLTRGFGSLVPSVRVITLEGPHDMVPGRDIDALGRALAECAREAQPAAAPALPAELP